MCIRTVPALLATFGLASIAAISLRYSIESDVLAWGVVALATAILSGYGCAISAQVVALRAQKPILTPSAEDWLHVDEPDLVLQLDLFIEEVAHDGDCATDHDHAMVRPRFVLDPHRPFEDN